MRLGYLSLPAVFMAVYVGLVAVPALFHYRDSQSLARFDYLLAIQSVLLVFPLGVLAVRVFALRRVPTIGTSARPIRISRLDLKIEPVFWVMLFLALTGSALFVLYSTTVPLGKIFMQEGSSLDAIGPRFEAYRQPLWVQFAYAMSRRLLFPLCTLYAYYRGLASPPWRLFSVWLAVTAIVCCALSLDRGPIVMLMGMLLLAKVTRYENIWSWRAIRTSTLTIALIVLLGGFITAWQYKNIVALQDIIDGIAHFGVNRLLNAHSEMALRSFETFPTPEHFLEGRFVRLFAILTGGEYVRTEVGTLLDRLHYLPVTFVGDLWRNWGWPAVLIGSFMYGMIFAVIETWSSSAYRSVSLLSLRCLLVLNALVIIPGGAFGIATSAVLCVGCVGVLYVNRASMRHAPKMSDRNTLPSPLGAHRRTQS